MKSHNQKKHLGLPAHATGGFSMLELLLAVVVLIGLAFLSHYIFHANSSPSSAVTSTQSHVTAANAPPANSSSITLKPATVPPKVAECSAPITFASNGTSGPIQCPNGALNVTAWKSLAALEPRILALGYNPTVAQAEAALCQDVKQNISNPIEAINYQIASLYYGWHFASSPTVVITDGQCQNIDD